MFYNYPYTRRTASRSSRGGIVSLTRPRTVLYYLTVIDGLMLAKAVLDILAMQF